MRIGNNNNRQEVLSPVPSLLPPDGGLVQDAEARETLIQIQDGLNVTVLGSGNWPTVPATGLVQDAEARTAINAISAIFNGPSDVAVTPVTVPLTGLVQDSELRYGLTTLFQWAQASGFMQRYIGPSVADPAGGTTVDTEARTTLTDHLNWHRQNGDFAI